MASFPTFKNGIVSQIDGYSETDVFYTLQSYLECGVTSTFSLNPGKPQKRTTVQFSQFTHSEMFTLETFFYSMGGELGTFAFTDDNGTVWPKSRFDQDRLELQYNEAGSYGGSAKLLLGVT